MKTMGELGSTNLKEPPRPASLLRRRVQSAVTEAACRPRAEGYGQSWAACPLSTRSALSFAH